MAEERPRVGLIHPIYLDVPMLVSFAAAIEGGLALSSEVTKQRGRRASRKLKASGSIGLSRIFSPVLSASVNVDGSQENDRQDLEVSQETKAHTEASIAILLYDRLTGEEGYVVRPADIDEIESLEPGALVELSGTVLKNAVDSIIDFIDAVAIMAGFTGEKPDAAQKYMQNIRASLDRDRKRTPISNVQLLCTHPPELTAVVTLRTENLRDLTLSELHKNSARVLGKVTRVVRNGESMSAFENYGLAMFEPNHLRTLFQGLSSADGIVAEFSDVQVAGPAVQLLPLMIFV